MTEDSIRKRPDMMSGSLTSYEHSEQVEDDDIDIVGRTRLPLLSLSGLDQTPFLPLLQEPAGRRIVPLQDNAVRKVASPPLQASYPPVVEVPLTPRAVDDNGSGKTAPYAARLAGAPLANKKATGRAARKPILPFILFIVLSCLFIVGLGSYIYFVHASPATRAALPRQAPANDQLHNGVASTVVGGFASVNGESFPVGGQAALVIKGQKGNVNVTAGNAGTITVKASSDGQSVDVINRSISSSRSHDGQGHDVITITTAPGDVSVDYAITMPASAQIQVEGDAGSISIAGVSGVSITVNSGSLDVENVNGPVNVSTSNGNITARRLKGSVVLKSVNGSINADTIAGQLKASTQNGDVTMRAAMLNGQSTLKTSYGSVNLDGSIDAHGTYTLGTHNGNVNLTLPGNTSFQMQASTASGSIHNEFGHNVVGHTPQAPINISILGGGSITINKAA